MLNLNSRIDETEDIDSLRVEARFKNGRLFDAIVQASVPFSDNPRYVALNRSGPVKKFCDLYGLSYGGVCDLLNLRVSPVLSGKKGLRPVCQKIADILDYSVDYLFPPALYAVKWPTLATYVNPAKLVPLLSVPKSTFALEGNVDEAIAGKELRRAILTQLRTLTPREASVIKDRFGLGGAQERTLSEIAGDLGVGTERVRQIEAKALRKLRHPSRVKHLRPFLYGLSEWDSQESTASQDETLREPPQIVVPAEAIRSINDDGEVPPVQPLITIRSTWRRHLVVKPSELASGDWWPDPQMLSPTDAIDPEVSRLFVLTRPESDVSGIAMIVEGSANRAIPIKSYRI